jgi:hypothetical protein
VSFGDDIDFLRRHTETVVLSSPDGTAQVALCPQLQGRVAVSTAAGESGPSFGWINRALIASGKRVPHMNVFGGADRFWLGPEGGPFSLFFAPGAPQDLQNWQTPPPIDSEPFTFAEGSLDRSLLRKAMLLPNASGTLFDLEVAREVRLHAAPQVWAEVGVAARTGVAAVGFETRNRVTNTGAAPWQREGGLISIWIAGTFAPSPATTIVIPYRPPSDPDEPKLGRGVQSVVNDRYFGRVAPHRLLVKERAVYFLADGQSRAKIGLPPRYAQPVLGSYEAQDPDRGVLTVVTYTLPPDAEARGYVSSLWGTPEDPLDPYAGDVVNAYNDGPATPGAAPFGPFYELETSSPALALGPGESAEHVHRTLHFSGAPADLDPIARAALGVGLNDIVQVVSA